LLQSPAGQALREFPSIVTRIWNYFFLVSAAALLWTVDCHGFALRGPFADWMTPALGYRYTGEIGGAVDLNEEYRWNVPVASYAFDQSFLDFFGTNGVAAVEEAIAILNAVPSSSQIVMTNFPFDSTGFNFRAQNLSALNLKYATLGLLLEQLGLAQPVRNIWDLLKWNDLFYSSPNENQWGDWAFPECLVRRNFDPATLQTTNVVNGDLYVGYVYPGGGRYVPDAAEFPIDPDAGLPPITEQILRFGAYPKGLTPDDVGGLRYLLSSNNVNFERLLPDVHGYGTNAGNFINAALRGGVEKVTFVRQNLDPSSGQVTPLTNRFIDHYLQNGIRQTQQLERVISTPDFLFSAGDNVDASTGGSVLYKRPMADTWDNCAALNGAPGNLGPGVIRPPGKITFHKLGATYETIDSDPVPLAYYYNSRFGSFSDSTNAPVIFPVGPGASNTDLSLRFELRNANYANIAHYTWHFQLPPGGVVNLQISSNLLTWADCGTVTNEGVVAEWMHVGATNKTRFFRAVKAPLTMAP
jgi:hypothetical protein